MGLQENRRARAVDVAARILRGAACLVKLRLRLDGRQSFVHELDRDAGKLPHLLGEASRAACREPLGPVHVSRKSHEKQSDPFLLGQTPQFTQRSRRWTSRNMLARMSQQSQFVGHGDTDSSSTIVEGGWALVGFVRHPHRLPELGGKKEPYPACSFGPPSLGQNDGLFPVRLDDSQRKTRIA